MFAGLICRGDPCRPPSAARSFFINQKFYSQRRTNKYIKFVVSDYRNWEGVNSDRAQHAGLTATNGF